MSGTLHTVRKDGGVVLVEIDNPPRNTMGHAMRQQLLAALDEMESDLSVHAVVLTGRGKAFCSGDDLKEALERGGESLDGLAEFGTLVERVENLRVPVIAAVNGWCVGGGLELALACDIRLAASEAQFVCAGVNVGLCASAYRLPRLIGPGRAKSLLLTGLPCDASTAEQYGLVTGVYDAMELKPAAVNLASRIASRAPLSVEATKRIANRALEMSSMEAAEAQANELAVLARSSDHTAAVTAFINKTEPTFTRS